MELEFRANHDHGPTGVVHALSEQVLPKAALLSFEHVAQRTQRTLVRTSKGLTTTAVVEERVHGLLEHALFVSNDDFKSVELHEALQPIISVDHATIKIVEIGGCKSTAIQGHKRTQF